MVFFLKARQAACSPSSGAKLGVFPFVFFRYRISRSETVFDVEVGSFMNICERLVSGVTLRDAPPAEMGRWRRNRRRTRA